MSDTPTVPSQNQAVDQILTQIKQLSDRQTGLEQKLAEVGRGNSNGRNDGPFIRKGENALSSRGFMYSRIAGVATKKLDKNDAKIELQLIEKLQKEYVERGFYSKEEKDSVVVPLCSKMIYDTDGGLGSLASEVQEVVSAGVTGFDLDEARHYTNKFYGGRTKALSWLEDLSTLVGPPVYGEPIALLRNQEAFMKLGARVVPFPPSGRIVWPRMTGATRAYWVGSGSDDTKRSITSSAPTASDLVLQVKKLGVYVEIPNELFRFPTTSVEQLIRSDMMLSAALKMDSGFLHSQGSATEPKGILYYDNIQSHIASTVGANGNTIEPEDIATMVGKVEEQNLTFGGWLGRPLLYAHLANKRADAVTAQDKKGHFLFNVLRDQKFQAGEALNNNVGSLEGYPFLKSNQVAKDRTKGSSSTLSYLLGGDFTKFLIALSGVMEFAVATQGSIFQTDRTALRLITWCDGAPEYEEAFVLCDALQY